ncbi:hypothetical protein [Streptomyces sp. NPDC091219]|uniref:hypothetical protein n=1 Tax=Streptomyces sp. NPDC091219 TaxID=3155193 RepID=UPI00344C2559
MAFSPAEIRASALALVSASSAPYPVVLVGGEGHVLDANPAARDVLDSYHDGQLALPGWLVAASVPGAMRAASGPIGDRFFFAYPTVTDSGPTVWWLVEETEHRPTAGEGHSAQQH